MRKEIKPTQPVMPSKDLYIQEIASIWDNRILTNSGEKEQRFREMLSAYTQCRNIDLFVNGHSALSIAIRSLRLDGEVITSPFTFISTTNAIVQNGLVPVFADIDDSYNIDPAKLEDLITPKTCAIITPHIFGIPCKIDEIEKIARKYQLKVIYDAAQAFGTKVNGMSIANFGDIAMFSFHAIKIFHTIEGGMLAYRQGELHRMFELYRNFGISYGDEGNDVEVSGVNAKMNEFQASMGIVNLQGLNLEIAKRKELAKMYMEELNQIPGIQCYRYKEDIEYNYAYFPIKIFEDFGCTRDELWKKLKERGIGSRKLYDKLTCDFQCYSQCGYQRSTEYADKIKQITLDLPIYGTLEKDDILYICETIKAVRK